MKNLNTSHRTFLENLPNFLREQHCYEETNEYVRDVLYDLRAALLSEGNPCYKFDMHGTELQGRYFSADFYPSAQGTKMPLISIGIDCFDIPNLFANDDYFKKCSAWVYSDLAAESSELASSLRQLPPPEGFVPIKNASFPGYVFVKELGKLSVDDFLNPSTFRSYFERPLRVLIDWVTASSPQLEVMAKSIPS